MLVATGVWNVAVEGEHADGTRDGVLAAKLVVVAASGLTAWLHTRATTPRGRGLYGALTAATALAALLLGVLLAG